MIFKDVLVLSVLVVYGFGNDGHKQVVSTEWWPAETEKKYEAVGIISHGLLFMTTMMDMTVNLEISDVNDIAQAGHAELDDLVDCLLHAQPGTGKAVHQAFVDSLPATSKPALSVIEVTGEYPYVPRSVTCIAALPSAPGAKDGLKRGAGGSVAAGGLLFIPGISADLKVSDAGVDVELPAVIGQVAGIAGGLDRLVDCTLFVQHAADLSRARAIIDNHFTAGTTPALTILQAGLEDSSKTVMLKCIAAPSSSIVRGQGIAATPNYVFTSGQAGNTSKQALLAVEQALSNSSVGLSDVVNCVFFVANLAYMPALFTDFYWMFNYAHFPPPSRGEFVTDLGCDNCTVVAKCVTAFPVPWLSPVV